MVLCIMPKFPVNEQRSESELVPVVLSLPALEARQLGTMDEVPKNI